MTSRWLRLKSRLNKNILKQKTENKMSTFVAIIKSILSLALMLFRYAFYRAISSLLTGLILLFMAILMFVTFYQAYMPEVSHVKPVYLQFSSDCHGETTALCTYPEASVFFTPLNKANEERMLMRGQAYKVFLDLEMPPSPTNEKLGMFMVNVKFLSAKGTVLKSASRSCMLHYESSLVRLFRTIFYSLPLTIGITEEKQKVELNFFDDYIDDSYNPAVQAKVVIMTKQIEIYSSTLRLQASFTGLRYLIFNWPLLFSCVAILGNFIMVSLLYSACTNQFMLNTNTTSNVVTQQRHVTNVQQQSTTTSQLSNGSTSTAVTTTPAANVETVSSSPETVVSAAETVSSNVQTVSSNVQTVSSNVQTVNPTVLTASEPTQENILSTSCEVRKQRYTRIASVKLKFRKKQPRMSHTGQRRVRNVKVMKQDIDDAVHESLDSDDAMESGVVQDTARTSSNVNDENDDSTCAPVKDSAPNISVSLDRIKMVNGCSPSKASHVRKRRKTDDSSNKTKKGGQCSKSTMWKITSKELVNADSRKNRLHADSEKNKLKEYTSESMEHNSSGNTRSQKHMKSLWENFCFAKNWESFKLPRIRRLGMYLQETMPSVSQNIRHCVSDLELSSVEERRLSEGDSLRRSVSASDISLLHGNSTIMSEICQ